MLVSLEDREMHRERCLTGQIIGQARRGLFEILLPPPHGRTLRAVAFATRDDDEGAAPGGSRTLPLVLTHMDDEDRDALVAYSYDLQRFALRVRADEPTVPNPGDARESASPPPRLGLVRRGEGAR